MGWRSLAVFMIVLNVVVFVALIHLGKVDVIVLNPPDLKPFDIATIALASSALVLTGTAVVVAIVTFLGYENIKQAAVTAAVEQALRRVVSVAEAAAVRTAREVEAQTGAAQTGTDIETLKGFTREDGGS